MTTTSTVFLVEAFCLARIRGSIAHGVHDDSRNGRLHGKVVPVDPVPSSRGSYPTLHVYIAWHEAVVTPTTRIGEGLGMEGSCRVTREGF